MLTGEEVLEVLFAHSGMTFSELFTYFFGSRITPTGFDYERHDRIMTLINCLRALRNVNLIKIDGIKTDDMREFISYCEYQSEHSPFHSTSSGPDHNKFRSSETWQDVRSALIEGIQYTSYFRTVCYPSFGKPSEQFNPASQDVFVMMPFSVQMLPIYQSICETARAMKLTIKRADDFSSSNPVMSDVWAAIWNAKVVVADCTGKNPNVFYEIGIAHTVGKPVVLIAQDKNDVPFDVRHIRYIEYQLDVNGIPNFAQPLGKALMSCLHRW